MKTKESKFKRRDQKPPSDEEYVVESEDEGHEKTRGDDDPAISSQGDEKDSKELQEKRAARSGQKKGKKVSKAIMDSDEESDEETSRKKGKNKTLEDVEDVESDGGRDDLKKEFTKLKVDMDKKCLDVDVKKKKKIRFKKYDEDAMEREEVNAKEKYKAKKEQGKKLKPSQEEDAEEDEVEEDPYGVRQSDPTAMLPRKRIVEHMRGKEKTAVHFELDQRYSVYTDTASTQRNPDEVFDVVTIMRKPNLKYGKTQKSVRES